MFLISAVGYYANQAKLPLYHRSEKVPELKYSFVFKQKIVYVCFLRFLLPHFAWNVFFTYMHACMANHIKYVVLVKCVDNCSTINFSLKYIWIWKLFCFGARVAILLSLSNNRCTYKVSQVSLLVSTYVKLSSFQLPWFFFWLKKVLDLKSKVLTN